ncbi:MAG TPA: hypothetical protein VJT49_20305 [Amycolatopsis sp.]|uniref:hypothetical protein n=1 Tax=Amycolatopsis sp. TaxID=37632 RepID=UPI002B47D0A4|nr:hypothetical protein [Amycolatopsis sp.]HKS47404.1 hypothetical protein [Amycolatopsis sp.]
MTIVTASPAIASPETTASLLKIAAERPCTASWCEGGCEPIDDIDGVTRLHTKTFWQSGDQMVVWSRQDDHTADGVIEGQAQLWVDYPAAGEESAHRDGLSAAFAHVYAMGRASVSDSAERDHL